ncbi:acyltransferase [Pseudooceanicola sediminis]|uniref:Acyltransferase n=1 Tax=Pseudooceanicola sediminis TaxID=2211117 RepID=A0A399IZU8_9RHOB|nr:acyltransferase [Pseudooceanicola sediminis]KAA2311714.1 acyltransferase [Puniceibacterium sp. HSS470]RII37122.1 acyltransferase [Pseudooceanicola sediminis]|tara:strand:- start:40987 stop:41991 length:1005 start_codon:yes stop_codon:yes gene_type:complete
MSIQQQASGSRTSGQAQGGRIVWLDIGRAIGIVLVVYGHVVRGLFSSHILADPVWRQVDFAIYTFHMPLFFFLSGMNVRPSREKPGFFARRARAIVLPYLVFSLLQGAVQVVLAGSTNGNKGWADLLLIPIFPISPFWFLYVLLIYVGVVSVWRPGWPMMAVAAVLLLLSPLARDMDGWILFQILYFFAFYVAGVLWQPPRLAAGPRALVGLGCLIVWAGGAGLALFAGVPVDGYYALVMLPVTLAGIGMVIMLAQMLEGVGGWLSYIGQNVIAIYVMHILAAAGTRIILSGFGISSPALLVVLGTMAGVVLPLIALVVMQRLKIARFAGLPQR